MEKNLMLVEMVGKENAKNSKKVLVTGATSGIGRAVIKELLAMKYEVVVLLRQQPSEHEEWKQLPSGVKLYVADVKNIDQKTKEIMMEAAKGASTLFHIAGATRNYKGRYGGEKVDTNLMVNTNVIGTENILQAFLNANPDKKIKIIYASTTSVYGHSRPGEIITEESELKPGSAYGESKVMAEEVIKAFAAAHSRLTYTILRIAVMYGPGYEGSFMKILKMVESGKIRYIGSGNNNLTLVNVDDVAEAMILAMQNEKSNNKIYNVTDGIKYTQRGLFDKAAKLINSTKQIKSIHPFLARLGARARGIDTEEFAYLVSNRVVSIERIKKELGWKPNADNDLAFKELAKEYLKTKSDFR
jgi:nucleoside-diphosphate-sugar epimerase